MIYSRFGTKLTPLSKRQDAEGRVSIQATAEGVQGVRDYGIADLTADDGISEINEAVGKLVWHVADNTAAPRRKSKHHRTL